MRFEVYVREERRRPVIRIGQLITEGGDSLRIQNNAAEWHRRHKDFAKRANAEAADVLGGKTAYAAMGGIYKGADGKAYGNICTASDAARAVLAICGGDADKALVTMKRVCGAEGETAT